MNIIMHVNNKFKVKSTLKNMIYDSTWLADHGMFFFNL